MTKGNYQYFIIIVVLQLLSACNKKNSDMEKITVRGIAQQGKGGALLITDDKIVYYIDALDAWDAELVGKQIEATGLLKIELMDEADLKNEAGEYNQGIAGEKQTLLEVMWKEVE